MALGRRRAAGNRRLLVRLTAAAVLMFAFGYALWPVYDAFCDWVGINGRAATLRAPAATVGGYALDPERWVTVQFDTTVHTGVPWTLRPETAILRLHPGEITEAAYVAENHGGMPVSVRAVPSVAPGEAAAHVHKTDCFCFRGQTLDAGERRRLTVRFAVDADLPADIHTLTLSHAFFRQDGAGP